MLSTSPEIVLWTRIKANVPNFVPTEPINWLRPAAKHHSDVQVLRDERADGVEPYVEQISLQYKPLVEFPNFRVETAN